MDGLKGNSQSKDSKHGLILTPNYIEACHHHRSRLPLLDFLLATGESFVDELKPFLDTIKPEPKSDDDRDEFNSKSSDGDDDDSDSEDEEDDQKVQKRKMDPEKEEAWLQSIAFASPPQDESHITPQKLEDFIKCEFFLLFFDEQKRK
jgi:Ran GTPase-activating protein (RanGAP) involved in mRNA processing and transport